MQLARNGLLRGGCNPVGPASSKEEAMMTQTDSNTHMRTQAEEDLSTPRREASQELARLTPWFWTSSFQNWELIIPCLMQSVRSVLYGGQSGPMCHKLSVALQPRALLLSGETGPGWEFRGLEGKVGGCPFYCPADRL